MAEENASTEEKKKGGSSIVKWIIIAQAVLVLGAGGFFGYSLYGSGKAAEKPEAEGKEIPKTSMPLKSFIVNLMDKKGMGKRYLKLSMTLEVDAEEAKTLLSRFEPQIRDSVLFLLSSQTFSSLSTLEGKLQLKQSLLNSVNTVVGGNRVSNIFFTEFIVQ